MSLQLAAEHLAKHGRGNDTELVHMDKGEVQALRGLAQANGGNLTTNPHTGLTEAGFLSSILPTIAGAAMVALAPETGGLSMLADPMVAGLVVGAGDYALTGSLSKGIMAGLGAWGGGSMLSGLEGVGAQNLVQQGGDVGNALWEGTQQAVTEGTPSIDMTAAQNGLNAQNFSNLSPEQLQQFQEALPKAVDPSQIYNAAGQANAAQAGASGLTKLGALNASSIGNYAMNNLGQTASVLMPPLLDSRFAQAGTGNMPAQSQANNYGTPLTRISPNFQGQQPIQPNPYQAHYINYAQAPYNSQTGLPAVSSPGSTVYAAGGGLMASGPAQTDFMSGGDVYPMSQQQTPHYATPTQMPLGAQPTGYEVKTNPLTGEEMPQMAEGGIAHFANQGQVLAQHPDIQSPVVTEDDPTAAKMDSWTAAQYKFGKLGSAVGVPTASLPTGRLKGLGQVGSFKTAAQQDAEAKLAATQQMAAAPTQSSTDTIGMASGGLPVAGYAGGGQALGSYSDGGQMLKGPGDGMSDSIPAQIGKHQPARLADGEFVVPADVVSHLGNGSTDAGARKLYSMMDKIRKARTGKKKQAPQVKADKYLPV